MAMKVVRFRVREGHLEPLEPVALVEGSETEASVQVAEAASTAPKPKLVFPFRSWDMGVREPLTRAEIYEDVG